MKLTKTEYCGGCGNALEVAPLGGHYRCCADSYWSKAEPTARDGSGLNLHKQTCYADGATIIRHTPALYFYGARAP